MTVHCNPLQEGRKGLPTKARKSKGLKSVREDYSTTTNKSRCCIESNNSECVPCHHVREEPNATTPHHEQSGKKLKRQ
ncbi:hypothetical protein K443DRAFT_428459 [Laccaria amethystina LaAM-08-1]|uniref:Uncharacterized protein n=1 Tax=Laccaria amethystina LaAM-08-1 TaxID=1095629 RepID=A0A0C9X8G8_9AGAR|nr:hypothetical protein K443DRAFT_428459 [Laccaria amethystina LaAM-08-1]